MHNGSVTALSDGLGTGSTFKVRLPLAGARAATPIVSPDAATAHAAAEHGARRVLVVDDSADAAASLMTLLELAGHEVRTASDGAEAIEQACEFCPDIIFMDLGMPRVDGVEATRRIRALPQGRNVRIIALTGWGQEADRERTRSAGMDDHIVKPVSPEALQRILCEPVQH
jgi:CheY-like chemotaxis protein